MGPNINLQAGPDWSSIAEEILCPLCEYDLQGLAEPRCPECGYTFEWQDLFDPSRRLHRYVFEHHPEKSVRSFWKTTAVILRPRRFWRSLQPVQPSNPRRLVLYWVMAMGLSYGVFQGIMVGCIAYFGGWPNFNFIANRAQQAAQIASCKALRATDPIRIDLIQRFGSIENAVEYYYPTRLSWMLVRKVLNEYGPALLLPLPLVFWPWLMFVGLMVFRWSMRRARVRAIHVLRCCIYTSGTAVWLTLGIPFLVVGGAILQRFAGVDTETLATVSLWILGGLLVLMLYQLSTAYRLYLRFDHSIATVVCAQVIVILAGLASLAVVSILTPL
jgi:hypothetical protein